MRQLIAATDRAEAVKRIVREYSSLVVRRNTQKIQVNGGDVELTLTVFLQFSMADRTSALPPDERDRVSAIEALIDRHRREIVNSDTVKLDFSFDGGRVTYRSDEMRTTKDSAVV